MNRAAISLNFRNYTTAEGDFRIVLKQQPKNFEAVIGLGVALRGGGKIDEAEQQYLTAMKLNEKSPRPYYNLALLYQDYKGGQRPELEKAQQYYRDYMAKAGSAMSAAERKDAKKKIQDIDDLFKALAEAAKMQAAFEEMLRKQEQQQRENEAELKRMQELEKQQNAQPPDAPPPAADPNAPPAADPNAPPPPPQPTASAPAATTTQ